MKDFALSRQDTAVLKGIAICAMLFHHLYSSSPAGVENYSGILLRLGDLGKVCVSIFLFCSGYGLAASYANRKNVSLKGSVAFVARRFLRFYSNYWIILLIFIPISIFVFGRTFEVAYAGMNIPKRIVFELLAINSTSSYNITWWFNFLIVVFFLLFPVIYWLVERLGVVFVVLSLVLFQFCYRIPGNYAEIYFWQFPFVIGVYWSTRASKTTNRVDFVEKHRVLCLAISVVLLVVLVFLRLKPVIPRWYGMRMDPFLTCAITIIVILAIRRIQWLSTCLAFLGKHSMNIYLMHTFFNGYWHPQWLHTGVWMRNGLNFVVLLSMCLGISVVLEWIKERSGFNSVVNKLSDRMLS